MNAWATLLTHPSYLVGVRALHASLVRTSTPHPLVVLVTGAIDPDSRRVLEDDGCLLVDVDPIRPAGGLPDSYANPRFAEVWTKLAAWRLTAYERVVFLDADMLVVQNMDELFGLELPATHLAASYACVCNPNQIPTYPASWTPENCAYTHAEVGAAADGTGGYFNAGFLVLQPDDTVFEELMTELAGVDDLSAYPFAEQDFLNDHFRGRWLALPYVYNALKTLPFQHPTLWDESEVKNIHFIIDKPWQKSLDPSDRYYALDRRWWDVAARLPEPALGSVGGRTPG